MLTKLKIAPILITGCFIVELALITLSLKRSHCTYMNCRATLWFSDADGVGNITTDPNDCFIDTEHNQPCVLAEWICDDPPVSTQSSQIASFSGIIRPDNDTLTAINGVVWIMFASFLIIILLLSVQMGLSFFKKV